MSTARGCVLNARFGANTKPGVTNVVVLQHQSSGHLVVVIGAGPAGIFATRKLVESGHQVVLVNRDIKPGGLAEYGIYFNKHKMKEGIRKQFRAILSSPGVHYIGHVRIGEKADLRLSELQAILQPSATIIAVGAQGTKYLGIPGQHLPGVYHAKDLVYHYNLLPPFSGFHFDFGQRVAIIGIGNVMVDVAHYLVHEKRVAEVIVIARRGPRERAYSDAEIKAISANIDGEALRHELERIRARLQIYGEPVESLYHELMKYKDVPAKEGVSPTRVTFQYLSMPVEIVAGSFGHPTAVIVEDTELYQEEGEPFLFPRNLGTRRTIPVDSVVFAVGDEVDEALGIPFEAGIYPTNPHPDPEHPGDEQYQLYDPAKQAVIDGMFCVGWSRKASDGVVGKTRQDAERGVMAVNRYLQRAQPGSPDEISVRLARLHQALQARGVQYVDYPAVQLLERVEQQEAARRGLEFFKLATSHQMLDAIRSGRIETTK